MPVTKITTVGGLAPSVSPRSLPDGAGQKAHNLLPTLSEFRPLQGDVAVAPANPVSPKTIYRMARKADGSYNTSPADGWIQSADWRNYVKGQLNDDTTERTFYSFNTSDAPPRTIDALGVDRQLGVPAPLEAVAAAVNVVDEYTAEERDADANVVSSKTAEIIKANMVPQWVGDIVLSPLSVVGLVPRDAPEFVPGDAGQLVRLYGGARSGGAFQVTNTYTTVSPESFSWVMDAGLGGFRHTRGSGAAVIPSTLTETEFFGIPFYGRATTYRLNRAAFVSQLTALEVAGELAFTADQAEKLADDIDLATIGDEAKPAFLSHRSKVNELLALLGGGSAADYVEQVQFFYNRASTVSEINAAVDVLAEQIWAHADRVYNAQNIVPIETGS